MIFVKRSEEKNKITAIISVIAIIAIVIIIIEYKKTTQEVPALEGLGKAISSSGGGGGGVIAPCPSYYLDYCNKYNNDPKKYYTYKKYCDLCIQKRLDCKTFDNVEFDYKGMDGNTFCTKQGYGTCILKDVVSIISYYESTDGTCMNMQSQNTRIYSTSCNEVIKREQALCYATEPTATAREPFKGDSNVLDYTYSITCCRDI